MKHLHLNLYKKWFDMTKAGIKTEDYREITPYWIGRLMLEDGNKIKKQRTIEIYEYQKKNNFEDFILNRHLSFKKIDECIISNGYAKDRPQFKIKNLGIVIGYGDIIWGGDGSSMVFRIKHGEIIK